MDNPIVKRLGPAYILSSAIFSVDFLFFTLMFRKDGNQTGMSEIQLSISTLIGVVPAIVLILILNRLSDVLDIKKVIIFFFSFSILYLLVVPYLRFRVAE